MYYLFFVSSIFCASLLLISIFRLGQITQAQKTNKAMQKWIDWKLEILQSPNPDLEAMKIMQTHGLFEAVMDSLK